MKTTLAYFFISFFISINLSAQKDKPTEEDYSKFPDRGHFYECGSKKVREQFASQYKALEDKKFEEFQEKREENTDKEWEDGKVEEYSTKVLETGRYGDNTPLKIEENFLLKDGYIKKAGNNLIVEIGKFIGGQVEIEEKEREREANIYIDFAKTYQYKITLELPAGYTVEGVKELNTSLENETGGFSSSAYLEGNKLIIETSKIYRKNYLDHSQWKEMTSWLDLAHDFTQAKILLKNK